MHLVDIAHFYSPENGAVKSYLSAKAKWLSSFGRLRHSIIVPRTKDEVYNYGVLGVPSVPVPFTRDFFMPRSMKAAASMLDRLQPDCIEVSDPFQFARAALDIKKKNKLPIVAFCHFDLSCLVGQRFGWLAEKIMMRYLANLYRQFDLVITHSARMMQKLQENKVARVLYQPLGVDTSIFNSLWRDYKLRSRLSLSPNARLLVHASRTPADNKFSALVRAVEKLGPSYHVLIIGGGENLPSSKQVSCISLPQNTRALAMLLASCDVMVHTDSLPQNTRALAMLLASCDVMVHTDKSVSFGSLAKEAMACGLPVVGEASEELAELVDETTGVLVEPGNVDELVQGVRHAYRIGVAEMGRNARRKIVQHYDWDHIFPQLMAQHISLIVSSGHKSRVYSTESIYVNHQ